MRLALLLAALVALVPATANARMTNDQQRIALFTPIAAAMFPSECVPYVKVTITDTMLPGRDGQAGAVVTPEAWATFGPAVCTVEIRPWVGDFDDALFCQVLVHEYGHLAGFKHADVGIMRDDSNLDHPLPACIAAVEATLSDRDRIDTEFDGEATAVKKIKRGTRAYSRGVRYTLRSDDVRVLVFGTGSKLRYVYPDDRIVGSARAAA